jgi:hypothetical protein
MSKYQYLQLQPVEPDEDDSPLDDFVQDEMIDLTEDDDEAALDREWAKVMNAMKTDDDTTSDDAA